MREGMGCDRALYRRLTLGKLTLKRITLLRQSCLLNTLSVTQEKLHSDFSFEYQNVVVVMAVWT